MKYWNNKREGERKMELTIFLTCAICTILLVIVATKWVLDV